ncbi:MAG TPA: hypothetical protein PLI50_05845 [bacterium]|nr:hypothetical protein [bacterium]
MDIESSIWIEPRKISDTTGDIIVEVEFTPTDPPGNPVYAYIGLTVFDVEIANADNCYSETPCCDRIFYRRNKGIQSKSRAI